MVSPSPGSTKSLNGSLCLARMGHITPSAGPWPQENQAHLEAAPFGLCDLQPISLSELQILLL
jgi:hypothetical protein